tara:strand:+ start:2719 stop:3222 length:504 start_codon:yes stop_codon:yes gene_type:complete
MDTTAFQELTVLVVEDSDYYRRLIITNLEAMSVGTTEESVNGEDAFEAQQVRSIDLALVDLEMEPVNGLELTRKIRRDEKSADRELPIIMITAHTDEECVFAARDAGVTEILTKPITAESLYKRIYSVVMHPRPFVEHETFVGPDRRRGDCTEYHGPDRRLNGSSTE